MGPSFLINQVRYRGHAMPDDVFGPEKVELLDRCAAVERAGVKWTMHSDAPVSPLGTLHNTRVAAASDTQIQQQISFDHGDKQRFVAAAAGRRADLRSSGH